MTIRFKNFDISDRKKNQRYNKREMNRTKRTDRILKDIHTKKRKSYRIRTEIKLKIFYSSVKQIN